MSIRIKATSADVDKQIELLKFYPEILKKHYRPAMYRAVNGLSKRIKPTIPEDTGRARDTFKASVVGSGINMEGRVGWWGQDKPWYINIMEYGSKRHPINKGKETRTKKNRAAFEQGDAQFGGAGGTHIFVKGGWKTAAVVNGVSKRGFMAAGYSAMKPQIEQYMFEASEAVVKEMAVK